ncbi:MAG TPA: hypothetical protein VEU62_03040 [Bryobacterales bacterium]|nr:hypothetical protein [Bryobacterales bacterium]
MPQQIFVGRHPIQLALDLVLDAVEGAGQVLGDAGQQLHLFAMIERGAVQGFGGRPFRQVEIVADGSELFLHLLEAAALEAVE